MSSSACTLIRHPARVFSRALPGQPDCTYFVGLPPGDLDPGRIFVSVHGIARNALEHALLFQPWMDALGIATIAPLFTRHAHHGYQWLRERGERPSADAVLLAVLDDARTLLGLPDARVHMFGFSGGGQFMHRFMLRHRGVVERAVIAAAGWYTFPDPGQPYPHGWAGEDAPFADTAALAAFPPTRVLVGSRDRVRDWSLNRDPGIDAVQGRNRYIRGKRWVKAMNAATQQAGLAPRCSFQPVRGATHNFRNAMLHHGLAEAVVDFLFVPDPIKPTRREP